MPTDPNLERIPIEAYDVIELDLGDCPYYQHTRLGLPYPDGWDGCGACYDEPACVTAIPDGGWPSVTGYTPEVIAEWWIDLGGGDA